MNLSSNRKSLYLESLATLIIFHLLSTVLIQTILFFFHVSLNPISLIIPFFIWIFFDSKLYGKEHQKIRIITNVLTYLLIILFFLVYYSNFIEISFDGNYYHGDTMIQLVYGWNPITLENQYLATSGSIWGELYPKFTWIIGALFIQISKISSSGMMINVLVGISTGIKTFYFFKKKQKTWFSLLITLVIVFNPIFIEQFHSFYVDNVIANLMVILILANLEIMEDFNYKSAFIIIIISIILINVKFTSFAFAGLIDLSSFVYYLIKDKKLALKIVGIGVVVLVLGLFIGYSPYVVNLLMRRNIFWPLAGANNWVSADDLGFVEMEGMRSLQRFFYSITYGDYFNSLLDFNSRGYLYYDQRIGAMGMHFAKFLFLGPFLLIVYFIKKHFKIKLSYILMFIFFAISIMFNWTMVWKLRYVPHFWLMVPLTILFAKDSFKNNVLVLLLFALFLHQAVDMIKNTYQYNLWVTSIYTDIYDLYSDGKPYNVYTANRDFFTVIEEYRLKEYGVNVNEMVLNKDDNAKCHRVDMYELCFTNVK